jgi:hypothetical protein
MLRKSSLSSSFFALSLSCMRAENCETEKC